MREREPGEPPTNREREAERLRGLVVVVVGMHRSGTSALTRGLQALGVSLGDDLLPPISGENDKGFFEDMDIHRLGEQLMGKIGTAWHKLTPLDASAFRGPLYSEDRREAVSILASKTAEAFAFKNPRTAVLLPFWRCVFDDLDLDDRYVVAIRNPLECAVSLRARNGFHLTHGIALWAKHFIEVLNNLQDRPRVFVSYDRLLSDPQRELRRMSAALGLLEPDPNSDDVLAYCRQFLTPSLRHSRISRNELERSGLAPPFVVDLYDLLTEMSSRDAGDQAIDAARCSGIVARYEEVAPLLAYADAIGDDRAGARAESVEGAKRARTAEDALRAAVTAGDAAKQEVNRLSSEFDATRAESKRLAAELESEHRQREALGSRLAAAESAREQLAARLAQELEAKRAIASDRAREANERAAREEDLNAQLASQSREVQQLKSERRAVEGDAAKRDREFIRLEERNAALLQQYGDCRRDLLLARAAVTAMRSSTSWRLTAPVRAAGAIMRNPIGGSRAIAASAARAAWRRLPTSPERRGRLAARLFSAAPALFSWSAAYTNWATARRNLNEVASAARSPPDAALKDDVPSPASGIPAISVVVPSYNYSRHLEQRLRSILDQTLPPRELILIDDESNDDNVAIAERVLAGSRIRYRIVRNMPNARNVFAQWCKGVETAQGDLVWIAETDDWADPRFLETASRPFQRDDIVLSMTQSHQADENGNILASDYLDDVRDISPDKWRRAFTGDGQTEVREGLSIKNTIPNVSAVLFRRAALLDVLCAHSREISSYRVARDWCVYVNLLRHGGLAFSPEALNYHRPHEASIAVAKFDLAELAEIARMQAYVAREFALPAEYAPRARAYLESLVRQFELDRRWAQAQIEGAMRGVIAA